MPRFVVIDNRPAAKRGKSGSECFSGDGILIKGIGGIVTLKRLTDSRSEAQLPKGSMVLRQITRNIIGLVESARGCPVVVSEEVPPETLAASRIARGANRVQALSNSAGISFVEG